MDTELSQRPLGLWKEGRPRRVTIKILGSIYIWKNIQWKLAQFSFTFTVSTDSGRQLLFTSKINWTLSVWGWTRKWWNFGWTTFSLGSCCAGWPILFYAHLRQWFFVRTAQNDQTRLCAYAAVFPRLGHSAELFRLRLKFGGKTRFSSTCINLIIQVSYQIETV